MLFDAVSENPFGPRRRALLRAWGDHAAGTASGPGFDFTPDNRTARTRDRVETFLDDPTVEHFEAVWTYETLADAIMGGPSRVLSKWDDDIDALADRIETIRDATEYDPDWEADFPSLTAVWELFGRLHADTAPIPYSECNRGLEQFGFDRPRSFAAARTSWEAFETAYVELAGHATEGTDHEVPLNHEISEFFTFVATQDDETIVEELGSPDEYRPLARWRQEGDLESALELRGHEEQLEGFIEAKRAGGFSDEGPDDLWNQGYWEDWKQAYRKHVVEAVESTYDLTDLDAAEIEPLLDDLSESASLSTVVPAYMLGGRQGGILWSEFKSRSLEDPERTAAVLSYLYDEDEYIGVRLDRFAELYGTLDEGGGALLSLATILLTFAYPREYVFYKWSLMSSFFGAFADYDVGTGYDTDQYWKLNLACREQLLPVLDRELEDATLLDVHTLLYLYHKEYAE